MNAPFPYQQLLMEMIAIPALSREEHQRADFLELFLNKWGMTVTRIKNNLLVGDPESGAGLPQILMKVAGSRVWGAMMPEPR